MENTVPVTAWQIRVGAVLRLDTTGYPIVTRVLDEVVVGAIGTSSLEKICAIRARHRLGQ